jgi:hypothetical protein
MLIESMSVRDQEEIYYTKSVSSILSSMTTYIVKRESLGFTSVFLTYYIDAVELSHIEYALHRAGYRFKTTVGKVCNDDKMSVQFHIDWSEANAKTRLPDSKL